MAARMAASPRLGEPWLRIGRDCDMGGIGVVVHAACQAASWRSLTGRETLTSLQCYQEPFAALSPGASYLRTYYCSSQSLWKGYNLQG
jgi:hypothetical protein